VLCTYLPAIGRQEHSLLFAPQAGETTVIKKTAFALVAALIAGSASMAQAYEARDATTGLRTEFYYAPLAQLEREGVPMSARAQSYLRQHPQGYADARRGNGYSFRNGSAYDARAQAPALRFEPGFGNWRGQPNCEANFDSSGAPVGPYEC